MAERWLPVVGWEGLYEVSDYGRVRSVERLARHRRGRETTQRLQGKVLKQGYKTKRYPCRMVILCRDGRMHTRKVHILMLEAFVGPRPPGMHGLHRDDDLANNHISNLRWGTPTENMQDRLRNGKNPQAAKTQCPHGHEYTPENTYVTPEGWRQCITCRRAGVRAWRKSRREQELEYT